MLWQLCHNETASESLAQYGRADLALLKLICVSYVPLPDHNMDALEFSLVRKATGGSRCVIEVRTIEIL